MKVYRENYRVYGARRSGGNSARDGVTVARCTVERLMRAGGIEGARRGKKVRTTVADPKLPQPGDLLKRDFTAPARTPAGWSTSRMFPWAGRRSTRRS